jgi:hypothetical protein
MVQCRCQVRIRDLLHTEIVKRFQIRLGFGLFELWDCHLAVVNGQEEYQLFEVENLLIRNFNAGP